MNAFVLSAEERHVCMTYYTHTMLHIAYMYIKVACLFSIYTVLLTIELQYRSYTNISTDYMFI